MKIYQNVQTANFFSKMHKTLAKSYVRAIFATYPLLIMNITNLTLEQKMQGCILAVICFVAIVNYIV